jgi:glycosyltransferase involved in cell wall biosynthesis
MDSEGFPRVCLLCPFDLGRPSGTPLRAGATLEALRAVTAVDVLATTDARGATALRGVISERRSQLSIGRFALRGLAELRRIRPAVVHCVTPLGLLPALAARMLDRRMRVVVEFHAPAEYEMVGSSRRARAFFRALDRRLLRRADAVIAMSNSQLEYLHEACGVERPIHVSWGPIDVSGPPPPAPHPSRPLTFGYFGNAHFWQGLDVLLSAAERLNGSAATVVLGGVDAHALPRAAPPGTSVLGTLAGKEMLTAMEECDVLVSPRRGGIATHYQYPFKLSAYLAARRPVIGTDVNDQGAIIKDARCGVVVPPDDPEALAEAMRELAAMPAPEIHAMGDRARAFAEANFGYEALRETLRAAYLS